MKITFKYFFPVLVISSFFLLIYKIYIPRINAFGCFDDCFNFIGGYFITYGLTIFSDFYFNHQPGMAYISGLIQQVFQPGSIAELILRHRQFILLASFIFSLLLYFRFGYRALFAVILYEVSKFYVFGDRFLAEGLVAYIIIYQCGVIYEMVLKKKSNPYDVAIMPIATWLIVFLREPYILATLTMFLVYAVPLFKRKKSLFYISGGIFFVLSITTILSNSPKEYFFNVITINKDILTSDALNENLLIKLIKIVFYPIYFIFSSEPWTILRIFIANVSIAYVLSILYVGAVLKKWKFVLLVTIILTLVNLRPGPANVQFFEAFNLAVWLIALIFTTIFLTYTIAKNSKKAGTVLSIIILFAFLNLTFNKSYFAYEKIDTNEEFFTNFSYVMDVGTTIRNLSESNDTLFVDGYDDIIIWEAKLKPSYKYGWYTSFMPKFHLYTKAREEMFVKDPPDFYYGVCLTDSKESFNLTSYNFLKNYHQLGSSNNKGCVYINKEKLKKITDEKWKKIDSTRYFLQN